MSTTNNRLKAEIVSDTEITMQRSLKAPRELVYRAMTDPDLIPKWWGQRGTTTVIDQFDARVGGAWRFIQKGEDGEEYAFRGTFLQLDPPSKIVQTFEFEPMPGHMVTDTMTLTEIDGGTLVRIDSKFETKEDLDGMLQSGMEIGANESYDRLEELLTTLV